MLLFTGPLLYHYADIENETSIELSFEEVKRVVKKVGFLIQVILLYCGVLFPHHHHHPPTLVVYN